jgi:uncharacterized membrane protein
MVGGISAFGLLIISIIYFLSCLTAIFLVVKEQRYSTFTKILLALVFFIYSICWADLLGPKLQENT